MTPAASRRRGAAVLALTVLLSVLALWTTTRSGAAQVFCEQEDGTFVPCDITTTTEETTTSVEETTTTEDDVDDTDTTEGTVEPEELVTEPSVTVSTLRNVLIPGDGTEGAENTTTTSKTLASGTDGLSDETLILLVVGGLGMVAAVVGLLTWRYWTATRPTVADPRGAR
ncbi:MAG TPA: hypothetical protein VJ804_09555 [Acidimicrobiales bacterium]|nr:hypothetical protein [Acidimicrobiales bacterium]